MLLEQFFPLFSALISFAGLVLVVMQLRANAKQQELNSLVEIYDINRQLLSLGFDHPQLFEILADAENLNPVLERRYLQLWLNQFDLIYSYMSKSVFKHELEDSLVRDVSDFMTMKNMQRHWREHGTYYSQSFQDFINGILKKKEPPKTAARLKHGRD